MADYAYAATGSGLLAPHHFPNLLFTYPRDGTWERFESSTLDFRATWNAGASVKNDDDSATTPVHAHVGHWNRTDYPSLAGPTFSGTAAHPDWFVDWIDKYYANADVVPYFEPYYDFYRDQFKNDTASAAGGEFRALSFPPVREALWGSGAGKVSAFFCGVNWCAADFRRPWSHYGNNPGEPWIPGGNNHKCKGCGDDINPLADDVGCYTGDYNRGQWSHTTKPKDYREDPLDPNKSYPDHPWREWMCVEAAHMETSQAFYTACMGHPIGAMAFFLKYRYIARGHGWGIKSGVDGRGLHYCMGSVGPDPWAQHRGFANTILLAARAFLLGFQWMDPEFMLTHFGTDTRQVCEDVMLHALGVAGGGYNTPDRPHTFGFPGCRPSTRDTMARISIYCEPWASKYNKQYVDPSTGINWGQQITRLQPWHIAGLGLNAITYMLRADEYAREMGLIDESSARADQDWAVLSLVTRNKALNYRNSLIEFVREAYCWDRRTNSADDYGELEGAAGSRMDTGVWCVYTGGWGGSEGGDVEVGETMPSKDVAEQLLVTVCEKRPDGDSPGLPEDWYYHGEAPTGKQANELYPKHVTTIPTYPGKAPNATGWIFKVGPRSMHIGDMYHDPLDSILLAGVAASTYDFDLGYYDKYNTWFQYILRGDVSGDSKRVYGDDDGSDGSKEATQNGLDIVERVFWDEGDSSSRVGFNGFVGFDATMAITRDEVNFGGGGSGVDMIGNVSYDHWQAFQPTQVTNVVTFAGQVNLAATMARAMEVTAPTFTAAMEVYVTGQSVDDGTDFGVKEFARGFSGSVGAEVKSVGISIEEGSADAGKSEDKDMLEYMTLEHMRLQVARHIGDTSSSRAQKIDEWINTAYSDVARAHRWPNLLRGRESGLSAVAGEKYLFLPKDVQQLYFIFTSGYTDMAPHQVIENMFQRSPQTVDSAGLIESWADAGEVGIKTGFSSTAEQIQIDPPAGAAASDQFNVLVSGLVGDDEVSEATTVIGTTSSTTTNSYDDLYSVSTDGNHTGTVTVKGVTSGTTYATIGQYDRTARYRRIRLHHVPNTAETVQIYYKKRPLRLVYDDQVPEIPVSQYLIERAVASHYSQQRKWGPAMQMHEARAQKVLDDLVGEELTHGERVEQAMPVGNKGGSRGLGRRGVIVVNNG